MSRHRRSRARSAHRRPDYEDSTLPRTIVIVALLLTALVAGVSLVVRGLM